MDYLKSPLRYPGGKSRAVKEITKYFPKAEEYIFTFTGGASIELFTFQNLSKNIKCYDVFQPLINFWNNLSTHNDEMVEHIQRHYPLPRDAFYSLQKNTKTTADPIQQGAEFYVLNRCSFSGSTLSGGISPNHPRFTEKGIESLRKYKGLGFAVENKSFEESISKTSSESFIYLDPPYKIKGDNLYGDKGSTHKFFNHLLLRDVLQDKKNWIMSYNDSDEIRNLYSDYKIISLEWAYGMTKNRKSKEILIFGEEGLSVIKQ